MLLLAMWPEAKLLRCPRGQRNMFEERSTVCVCVKMLKGMVPELGPDPRAHLTYRCKVSSEFLVVPEGPGTC